jgi:SAM-dependent methyltransferase
MTRKKAVTVPSHSMPGARRTTYDDSATRDRFIVAVLRDGIREMLCTYASSPRPGARALDVGCGNQPFRNSLQQLGYRYVGLDVEQNADGTVDVIAPIDGALPASLSEGSGFDLVLCTEVLEHVADWQLAFRNLAMLLAPGGTLLVTSPFFYPLHEQPIDYWRATPYVWPHLASNVGLTLVSARLAGDAWDVLGTWLGHTSIVAVTRSLPNRILARFGRAVRWMILCLLVRQLVQPRLRLLGDLYVSNIVVFRRPSMRGGVGQPSVI